MERFIDLGTPVDAVESRTGTVCIHPNGQSRIVLAARGFVIIVDPLTGVNIQLPFPEQNNEYPYASFSDSKGMFYTGAGRSFLVLDPFQEAFIYSPVLGEPDELLGFGFAEDRQGSIFFTSYPRSQLYRYSSETNQATSLICLDSEQKYPSSLATDSSGWIYAGLGTVSKAIVAYHPARDQLRQLIPQSERTRGAGIVYQGQDGNAYGYWDNPTEQGGSGLRRWIRLEEGEAIPLSTEEEAGVSFYQGSGFDRLHRQLTGEWHVQSFDLSERVLVLVSRHGEEVRELPLYYASEGAQLSPMMTGPDEIIYGTSNHPLHFYSYNPRLEQLQDYGGQIIEHGGGGNICAYAVSGKWVGGAAYAGGHFHLLDTTKPIIKDGKLRNPKRVTTHEEIHRPRTALAHSDGKHMIYGGYPGYGSIGGGLCIYHLEKDEDQLYTHDQICLNRSTVCLVETEQGDILGGTSIETPGGAQPLEEVAVVYHFDWKSRAVIQHWTPVEAAREFIWIDIASERRLIGLTSDSLYFVYDLEQKQLLHCQDLSSWGTPVRTGMVKGEDGRRWGVLSRSIYRIDEDTLLAERLSESPGVITAGLALLDNRLYMGMASRLWSYNIHSTGRSSTG